MNFPTKWIAGAIVLAACALSPLAFAYGNDTRADDDAFLLLRDAARRDDMAKVDFYADRLANYSLRDYVDYYRLKPRLKELAPEQFRDFLTRYKGSALADRFRNDWLLELGRKRDWATFDEQYPQFVINDDTQVKCYALTSRALKGQNVAAEARALLTAPAGYGEPCGGLIAVLAQSGQFDANDLWAQARLAGEADATGQARRLALLLGNSETKMAQAVDLPALALARGLGASHAEHETYLVAVGRMARTSVKLAVLALNRALPSLTQQEQAIGWADIALQASYKLNPDTGEYWRKSAGAPLSLDQMQWKTRIALREKNWPQVQADIRAMPASLRGEAAWTYWLGRALRAQAPGRVSDEARELFRSISEQSNFYGLLALEELGMQVTIPPSGLAITPAEIAPIAANPGFQRALKFFGMRLRFEGTREWNWELRTLSEREHLAVAEFARQNNILDRMVNTSERTRVEVDYSQRYPAPHDDIMNPATQTLGLDRAWVYGLIRQESRFIMDAQSSVGASGLMQVMPSTGRYVAKKIGLTDFVQSMLSDVRTNILLGTNYLNMVIGGLDGSQVLATAAYNAGPGRLRTWRATLRGPVEGAIFAESIPFTETRVYVKNVMSNATYYAALFENRPQSLKARLGTVGPKAAPAEAALSALPEAAAAQQ
ncbi:MAG TPA: lytic transglycosylase [Janthinobacterium sp.]|nr:lytic transglycosylase [Janthinobacterium sp.]